MRRSRLIFGAIASVLLSLVVAQPASAAPAFRALVFSEDGRLPARFDPRRPHDVQRAGRGQQLRGGRIARTRPSSPRPTSPPSTCSSCSRPRAWFGPRRPASGGGGLPRRRQGHRRDPQRHRHGHRDRVPVVGPDHQRRRAHAGALPRRAAGHRHRRRQGAPVDGRPAGQLESAARSGTTSTATPAATSTSWSPRTSARTTRAPARWGRTTRSPGAATPAAAECGPPAWATTIASYSEANFRNHVLGGVKWAAGNEPGDCGGTVWGNFEKRTLDDNTADPMALAVAPDGRVLYVQRGGQLKIFKPTTNSTVTAGHARASTPAARTASPDWRWTRTSPPTATCTCITRRPAARPTSTGSPGSRSPATP